MEKIESTTDLPKWFKLKNYSMINDLEPKQIYQAVFSRIALLQQCELGFIKNKNFSIITSKNEWLLIQKGKILNTEKINGNNEESEEYNSLQGGDSVEAFPAFRAIYFVNRLINQDRLSIAKDTLFMNDSQLGSIEFDFAEQATEKFRVTISIDLKDNTNKVILSEIEKLLPQWRESLKLKEPTNIIHSKRSDYKKIIIYQIIPLLDLMIWEKLNNKKIPYRIYTIALFPYGEKGETEFKQTIIPFLKKILSANYREIWNEYDL